MPHSPSLSTPDAPRIEGAEEILTPAALAFVGMLVEKFAPRVAELLALRHERQVAFDAGELPDFRGDTQAVRDGDWRVAELPPDLLRRVVEITGPVDRKMIINALNSGADVFMADFEDSCSPTWENVVLGQLNLRDAVAGTIDYHHPETGKRYRLADKTATLMVRPRGWHLPELHLRRGETAVPAALVDFGLYFFHNARALLERGTGPYLYLPKMQSHLEARLWNEVFVAAQKALSIPNGTIKATVLIETLPAVFEMDEILYELREHAAGLNCGRWDYTFSYIKTFRNHPAFVLPDRGEVGMTQPFMRAYTQLLIKTCHRRGAFAMGGMAAQIPIKEDPAQNDIALAKVRADKEREANDGHDGTWVAHPGLVALAREPFERVLRGKPNQLDRLRAEFHTTRDELIAPPTGARTDAALRHNIRVGIQYLEAWLRGNGCVPLYHLMEDAATAEISRTQIWQWLHHSAITTDGLAVTHKRVEAAIAEEMEVIAREVGDNNFSRGKFGEARALFARVATQPGELVEFLTLPAYQQLVGGEHH